jgi:hypothetical protein
VSKHSKNCSECGSIQYYSRKDHLMSAIRGDWKCKSCTSRVNTPKAMCGPMPLTWYEMKRKGGISRGYYWDLTPEYILQLYETQDRQCALTGWDIGWSAVGLTATVSIDRIDSSEGYIQGNIQLLHKDVNMAKQQYSQDYFIELCKAVADKVKW